MVVVVAGCLPKPAPSLPQSFISEFYGGSRPTFTVQTPPAGVTGQDMVATLRASGRNLMFQGRAVPFFGVFGCEGLPQSHCTGVPPHAVWLVLYPDCTDATGDSGWALVDPVKGLDAGYSFTAPCPPNG
jgi:hypothetical protein